MRVLFMGTPDFAVPSLQRLVASGFDVAAVVTQPDRPVGRGGRVQPPAVKSAALALGRTVLQPERLRDPATLELFRSLAPDVIVVVAYGRILRRDILDLPPLGCVNVHPSLLPRLRGASPMQAAIREGLATSGVTIMLMNERMDAGPILSQLSAPIFPDDTAASLSARFATLGADLLVDTVQRWASGAIQPVAQDDGAATYCQPLRKEDANVDWGQPAEVIARISRAQTPWPGCQSRWAGTAVQLFGLVAHPEWKGSEPPGTVVLLPASTRALPLLAVATADGAVAIPLLQLPGKRPLPAADFLRGQPRFVGARLGS